MQGGSLERSQHAAPHPHVQHHQLALLLGGCHSHSGELPVTNYPMVVKSRRISSQQSSDPEIAKLLW